MRTTTNARDDANHHADGVVTSGRWVANARRYTALAPDRFKDFWR
jgi:hypothetical protein